MTKINLMCPSYAQARSNRERIARGGNSLYYTQQAALVAQWKLGEPVPRGIALGTLPYVGKH